MAIIGTQYEPSAHDQAIYNADGENSFLYFVGMITIGLVILMCYLIFGGN